MIDTHAHMHGRFKISHMWQIGGYTRGGGAVVVAYFKSPRRVSLTTTTSTTTTTTTTTTTFFFFTQSREIVKHLTDNHSCSKVPKRS